MGSIKSLKQQELEFHTIFLGGILSLLPIVTAASVNTQDVDSIIDLAKV